MAAKILHSLSDDNVDLQRQIGCMTGIFQLFDRQQIIGAKRIGGLSPKRPPSGSSRTYDSNYETESDSVYHRPKTNERNSTKNVYEKRVSHESARPSFSSSSRSSSFSSLDCNIKISQPDPSPYDRIIFPETPSRDPAMSQTSSSPQYARYSLDLRDVVKDSIYKETRGLSVKTSIKDESYDRATKIKDSPRQALPSDVKESFRVLSKLREAPWYCDEIGENSRTSFESKSGDSMYYVTKNAPRFSCDGRETTRTNTKHKEHPRLSLDSREHSMRSFNSENKTAGPSVVAKLMGLETLPTDVAKETKGPIKSCFDDDIETFSGSSKPLVLPVSNSMRNSWNSWKDPASPRRRNGDVMMKPVPSSRFPLEPAPWKHPDGAHSSQKTAHRNVKTLPKPINATVPSVYSEIEKRLKDLEFTQSGKDLRALKQIIEAMQAKGLLVSSTKREGLDGGFATQLDPPPMFSRSPINTKSVNKEKAFESPIVIMKPAKLVPKLGTRSSSGTPMDRLSGLQTPRGEEYTNKRKVLANNKSSKEQVHKTGVRENGSTVCMTSLQPSKSVQSSIRSQKLNREKATSSVNSTASVSPRLQQKKLELEKKSRPPISPDPNKVRRQPIKNQSESSSPGGKRRPKIMKKQQKDDQSSEVSSESRDLNYQEDDLEVTSLEQCRETNGSQSPSLKAANYAASNLSQQRFPPKLIDGDLTQLGLVAPEQPSPVSVLDDTMYADDALSPVKLMADILKDEATVTDSPNREEQKRSKDFVSNTTINRKKLENIENLVQKLRRLNSTHDEAHTDYIASLCDNTNPDHRYISEILLASGLLLRDLNSSLLMFQLHPSGYPINPQLFFVLEQTKASTLEKEKTGCGKIVRLNRDVEKFHRKLIFDAVNEILAKKLSLMGTANTKLARKSLNAQKLLRDLCSEIESLQAKETSFVLEDEDDSLKSILCEDVMNRSESWTDFNGELSGLVLDTERLIYKDLINEIVQGETVRTKPGRRCRQLFV